VVVLKRIKSYIYGIKLKYYIGKIQAEMLIRHSKGVPVPENYMWTRLDEILNKGRDKKLNTDQVTIFNEHWN